MTYNQKHQLKFNRGTRIKKMKGKVKELTLSVKWHGIFFYSDYKQLQKAPSTET